MELKLEHLVITTYRPAHQGAWSQLPVSGVRIVHLPTGAIAMCDTDRSIFKNRQEAMRLLEIKVTDIEESNLMAGTQEPSEQAKVQCLKNALQKLMDEYIRGGESGDWGYWNPHDTKEVIEAKAALALFPD